MRDDAIDFGRAVWSREDLLSEIDTFLQTYDKRPLRENSGGMCAPHSFYTWFTLRRLKPETVIESGVFRGHSTWLIEQALPDADIVSIDPRLDVVQYHSARARYTEMDFSACDWSQTDPATTLAFFDDHQNAYQRLQQCKWFGFRDVIFEDNYSVNHGDVYSLKKAFAGCGFEPPGKLTKRRNLLSFKKKKRGRAIGARSAAVAPNTTDATYILRNIETYFEFPPVCRASLTRWGDPWDDTVYPTKAALLTEVPDGDRAIFQADATSYTWLCYVRLK